MGKVKIGLALGGGAARGWAHIGVIKVLAEAGLKPDIVAGTSIGAVAGGCYAADKMEPLEEFACGLTRRSIFGFLDFNFGGSGLISGQRLCDRLDVHLEDVLIEDLGAKFVAVATEFGTGHEVWLSKGRLVDAVRASYALPGIFRPVRINGRWLMDGALVNPIPVSVCRALGARVVIAVNLNWDVFGKGAVIPDQEAIEETEDVLDDEQTPLKGVNGRAATRLLHRQFFGRRKSEPGISAVMMDAFNIIQDRIARARLAGDPPDISIQPRLADINLFDFYQAKVSIERGAEATERHLDDIAQIVSALSH